MFVLKCLSVAVVIINLGYINVYANMSLNGTGMHARIMTCVKDLGITQEQFLDVKLRGKYEVVDPCLFKCFFDEPGIIDSKGMYDVNKAMEFNRQHLRKTEYVAKMDKIKEDCETVNEQHVSDGEKGCERSLKLFQCYLEHHHKFDKDEE